jgi:AraC-like DNA-binding protein
MEGAEVFNVASGIPERISTRIKFPNYKSVFFIEDFSNNIWIATEQGGIYKVSKDLGKIARYSEADGLPNNSVSAMAEYPDGVLWMSTLKGISRFDVGKELFENFSMSDGLPGLIFNPGAVINNAAEGGQIWLGNEKGLVHFFPDSIGERGAIKRVRISDFYIDGKAINPGPESIIEKPIEETARIELKGNQNSFGFRFVALNYFAPSDNQYFYRLIGHDDSWKVVEGINQVFFQNLKPKGYEFEVCLATTDGKPDLNSLASLKIDIKPFFYQNFYIMGLLMLSLLAGLTFLFLLIRDLKRKVSAEQKPGREKDLREKYESSRLSTERSKEILAKVRSYIEENEMYLNADLKISDVGRALDYASNIISQVINQNLNKSFSEFINSYRVKAVKEKMIDPEYSKYTLIALAQSCGFNSKTSFYRIFKKETGQTPAEFLKGINERQ